MGFIRKARNTIVIGGLGLLGTLAGTKYDSIPDAYQKVLQTEIIEKKAYMQSIKDNKKNYKDKETYVTSLEEARNAYEETEDKLKTYKGLEDDSEKRKEALLDIKNYGMTYGELKDSGVNIGNAKPAAKGGMYGAGTGVVLLLGNSIRRGLKKRKNKKNLERRLSIFLGLLAGGIGLSITFSNFSGIVTGNVINNSNYSSSGIIGILLLIAGCIGAYFYFKE